MARRVMRKYQIEATFQTRVNTIHDVEMELEAEDGQQVWNALQDMAQEQKEYLIRAKVREINTGTGEMITVRPKKEEVLGELPRLLPPKQEEPEKRKWYEADAFATRYVGVWPCTYKTEEDNDTVTT